MEANEGGAECHIIIAGAPEQSKSTVPAIPLWRWTRYNPARESKELLWVRFDLWYGWG